MLKLLNYEVKYEILAQGITDYYSRVTIYIVYDKYRQYIYDAKIWIL